MKSTEQTIQSIWRRLREENPKEADFIKNYGDWIAYEKDGMGAVLYSALITGEVVYSETEDNKFPKLLAA